MDEPPSPCDQLSGLPAGAFRKADPSPDAAFYAQPRFVTHIDEDAIAAVTTLYREMLPAGGDVLDLMSSWVSHLPPETGYRSVAGHGMNAAELAANPRLTARIVQDLNADPALPFADGAFDGVGLCVSVHYLQRPVEVFREVGRVLRPGAPFVICFSNRCFPTKAVAIWQALEGADQQRLIAAYLQAAGFGGVASRSTIPHFGDPLWAVIGHAGRSPPRHPVGAGHPRTGAPIQPAADHHTKLGNSTPAQLGESKPALTACASTRTARCRSALVTVASIALARANCAVQPSASASSACCAALRVQGPVVRQGGKRRRELLQLA